MNTITTNSYFNQLLFMCHPLKFFFFISVFAILPVCFRWNVTIVIAVFINVSGGVVVVDDVFGIVLPFCSLYFAHHRRRQRCRLRSCVVKRKETQNRRMHIIRCAAFVWIDRILLCLVSIFFCQFFWYETFFTKFHTHTQLLFSFSLW